MFKKLLLTSILTIAATTTFAMADGDKKVTSKNYVDTNFQTKIPVSNLTVEYPGERETYYNIPHTVVLSPTTNAGDIGQYGILDYDLFDLFGDEPIYNVFDRVINTIPTTGIVSEFVENELSGYQFKIPKSGYSNYGGAITSYQNDNAWTSNAVKGISLVTRTNIDGEVGERKIFEANDVSNYHASGLTQTQKDIQDISIPTVGAMMTAISNGVNAATPTGNPNTIANFDSNGALGSGIATYTGAAAYNATNDSAKIPTMAGVTNYAQAKKVCVGWPDGVAHTDANCWLWQLPD